MNSFVIFPMMYGCFEYNYNTGSVFTTDLNPFESVKQFNNYYMKRAVFKRIKMT